MGYFLPKVVQKTVPEEYRRRLAEPKTSEPDTEVSLPAVEAAALRVRYAPQGFNTKADVERGFTGIMTV